MVNRVSASPWRLLVLLAGLLPGGIALADDAPAGIVWRSWGREPFEQARQQDCPLLLLLADDACEPCRARELATRADPALASVLGAELVLIRAERLDRPDLDDLVSLLADAAGSGLQETDDAEPGPRYPVLVMLLSDGRPFGVSRPGVPAEARGVLLGLLSLFRNERPQAEERATQLTETLRAGQRPTPAQRPLGPEVLDNALKNWADTSDASAGVRLLLEEVARTDRADLGPLLDRGLVRLAGEPDPASLASAALRLAALARGRQVTGDSSGAGPAQGLAQWIATRTTPEGLFAASPDDDRVIAGWNGLALSALSVSSQALHRPADLKLARVAAKAVIERLAGTGGLARSLGGSAIGGSAFLEDYAFLAQGFLDLHQVTQERSFLLTAQGLADKALARFYDVRGSGFFSTDAAHEPLPVRPKTAFDGTLPSGNGVMVSVLQRLARSTGETRYAGLAERALEGFAGDLERSPRGLATLATAFGESLGRPARPAKPAVRFPAQAVAGPVRFALAAPPAPVKRGQIFDLRLTMTVAPGRQVVAAEPGLKGLLGLAVSVPGEDLVLSPVRFPQAKKVRESLGGGEFGGLDGETPLLLRLRFREGVEPGERWVRVRVRFQPCGVKGCEAPDSVVLDTPVTLMP